jgi:chemotaxis protein methyltransferase CheR
MSIEQLIPIASVDESGPGFDESEYKAFQGNVEGKTGIRLVDYKPDQMRRRLSMMAMRSGFGSYRDYFRAMDRDPSLLAVFLDKMTINVSELLRNPQRFAELARECLPQLSRNRGGSPLRLWSAGCSYGAEAYTLAMLLYEFNPKANDMIVATDIDEQILRRAREPYFTAADMANISPQRRADHFIALPNDQWTVAAHLKKRVSPTRHDLLADPYPRNEYDLILCRNVVIYFTGEAKDRIYRGFFDALRPGGVLFVGGTERLADHRQIGFEMMMPFFYRKPLK